MTGRGLAVLLVVAPLWVACSEPAGRAEVRPAPVQGSDTCGNAESQVELTACWTREAERVQGRVADAQASLLSAMAEDRDIAAALARAHERWIEYRDAHCGTFARLTGGGSSSPLQRAMCEARLGAEREAELGRVMQDATR